MNYCPKISVIIPCYNSQKHISKCINSIIAQSYTDFELIIVNDCSTDNTHKIIQKYTYNDNRIIVVDHTKNKGAHAARLSGINIARGIYIAFIDSDDYVDVDYLEKLYNATEGEAIDMVCLSGHYQKFRLLQIKKQDLPSYNKHLINNLIKNPSNSELKKNFFGISQFPCYSAMKLYRKSILENIPNFDIFFNDDVLMIMYIFKKISSLKFISYYGYYYRIGGGSNLNNRYLSDFKKLFLLKKREISNWNFDSNFDPYTFILIELNNCFYEYFTRCILNGIKSNIIIDNIKCELSDELYNELNYLKTIHSLYTQEIQAILSKDYSKIYSIAKSKVTVLRKIKYFLSKII